MRARVTFTMILLFAGVVAFLATLFFTRSGMVPHRERAAPSPPTTPRTVEPPSLPGPARADREAAERLLAEGRLREAQDEYLKILLMNLADDRWAMQGLVAVQRRMANNDPKALLHRADTYRRAALVGAETPEHYSPHSLRLLYIANLMAAAQADAERTAKTAARASGAPAGRRIERAPAAAAAALPGPAKNPAAGSPAIGRVAAPPSTSPGGTPLSQPPSKGPASPAQAPGGSRAVPTEALPQLQPYHAPATVAPSRPAPPPGTPGTRVVPVQAVALERPLPERSVGTLRVVNCGGGTLGIDGTGGARTFATTSRTVIYAGTEKLAQFCALKRFIGSRVLIWGIRVGTRRTAERVSVTVVSASTATVPRRGQEGSVGQIVPPRPPVSGSSAVSWNETSSPGWRSGYVEETERTGIITTKINNAALVVSRDGAHPIVITPGTRVVGLRTSFGAISRFDQVRARGQSTPAGTLIANVIEVTMIPDGRQLQQMALNAGYVSANGITRGAGVAVTGQLMGNNGEGAGNAGASANAGGASVSAGASANAGGASVSAGAAANAGGASVSAGASTNAGGASVSGGASGSGGGASVSAGASANAGGASVSGGASANAGGASVSGGASATAGGASANAGGASVSGGASVNAGGASVSGGASANAGGASVSGGASVNAGGTSVSGGVSVNAGGASVSGGASGSGGGASVNAGGASVSGGASGSGGGVSVNAGGASVSGGASGSGGGVSVNAGGASVSGGASVKGGGVSIGGVGGGSGGQSATGGNLDVAENGKR